MSTTETAIPQSNKNMAFIIYILYIIGFFTIATTLIGLVLAYANKSGADPITKSHFHKQIKIFWRGFIFFIFIAIAFIIGEITIFFHIVTFALSLWWLIWTVIVLAKGITALNRSQAI